MFNAILNYISVIACRSVLLVEDYRDKTNDLPQITDKVYHILYIEHTSQWAGFELTTLVLIVK